MKAVRRATVADREALVAQACWNAVGSKKCGQQVTLGIAIITGLVALMMSYVIMPRLTRWLAWWL